MQLAQVVDISEAKLERKRLRLIEMNEDHDHMLHQWSNAAMGQNGVLIDKQTMQDLHAPLDELQSEIKILEAEIKQLEGKL